MPKISVLMPVYNTPEQFLREAVESILNQSYEDFEFLIINDGSTNNAEAVVKSYNDSRIRYIKNAQNLGLIKTLNVGIDNACGEYIARFDSDDISLPKRFEIQVDYLDKNPQVGVLGTQFESFPKKRLSDGLIDSQMIKEALLVKCNQIGHPTVMIRKSVLVENNIRYDNENGLFVEDYKLWLDLVGKTKFANVDEVLLKYRRHKASICSQNTINQNINCQKIMFEAQARYFNLDANSVLDIADRLYDNKKVSTKDLNAIINFVSDVNNAMKKEKFSTDYRLNHQFAKYVIKRCKKDLYFLILLIRGKYKIFFEK